MTQPTTRSAGAALATPITTTGSLISEDLLANAIANSFSTNPGASTNLSLAARVMAVVKDFMNTNNPLLAYSSGLNVVDESVGSITFKWDGDGNPFKAKTQVGNQEFKGVKETRQTVLWNKPLIKEEAMTAYDLKKGAINVLAARVAKSVTKFVQLAIKGAFDKIAGGSAAAIGGETVASINAATTRQEKGMKLKAAIVATARKFMRDTQYPSSAITVTLSDEAMEILSDAQMLGNAVVTSFSGGQYTMGIVGGFKVQSGENFYAPAGFDKFIVGTNDSYIFGTDIIAANAGRIGLTSDQGTYIEMTDMSEKSTHKAIDFASDTMAKTVDILTEYTIAAS